MLLAAGGFDLVAGGAGADITGLGSSIFEEQEFVDDEPVSTFEVDAWLTDQNAFGLSTAVGGTFDREYGVPCRIGVLLEAWATEGGVASTGRLD